MRGRSFVSYFHARVIICPPSRNALEARVLRDGLMAVAPSIVKGEDWSHGEGEGTYRHN